ncbi:MAG: hypothetical protein WA979_08420 [Pacificimonas sp.]
MKSIYVAAMAAMVTVALPSAAQNAPPEIKMPRSAWTHEASGLVFPQKLAGLKRLNAYDYSNGQANIGIRYDGDAGDFVTFYVYRVQAGSLPLWFHAAESSAVDAKEGLVQPVVAATPFPPTDRTPSGGLYSIHRVLTNDSNSGIMMIRSGMWLVKLRYTSASKTPEQLSAAMYGLMSEIDASSPDGDNAGVFATPAPVATCQNDFGDGEPALPLPPNMALAMMDAMMSGIGIEDALDKKDTAEESVVVRTLSDATRSEGDWCRLANLRNGYQIYLNGDRTDNYLLRLDDAGRAMTVGPSAGGLNILLPEDKEAGQTSSPRYTVRMTMSERVVGFDDYDRAPGPDQAIEIVNTTSPLYEKGFSAIGDTNVQIFSDRFPEDSDGGDAETGEETTSPLDTAPATPL